MLSPLPPQPESLKPAILWQPHLDADFCDAAAHRLAESVRFPTESYDDNGLVGQDPRWRVFCDLEKWMEKTFPTFHERFAKVNVNTHGLVFTLEGSDSSNLKPILLTGHQDVVPVLPDTLPLWTIPPYAGVVADGWIHGRGAFDNKSLVVGILEALEHLLVTGWKLKRTVVVAFGFDEECVSARQGAAEIAKHLEKVWGKDGFAFLLDEGDGMLNNCMGWAFLEVAERGYVDFKITVGIPGGHSACSPPYTAIGIVSRLVTLLETTPPQSYLLPTNPYATTLRILAKHSPNIPLDLKAKIEDPSLWDELVQILSQDPSMPRGTKEMFTCSRTVTVIHGGLKVNALPEVVHFLINQRISTSSSIGQSKQALLDLLTPIAEEYELEIVAFPDAPCEGKDLPKRYLMLETLGVPLEPSPVAPWWEPGEGYELLGGTIRNLFPARDGSARIVAPQLMYGATDTKCYWNLTPHIYRMIPYVQGDTRGAHTVDEAIKVEMHINQIRMIHDVVVNAQDWKGGRR
ncbi:hypothetical protein FB451DRAFT_1051299 [Mycena latifolia]|nr:hypothetical protein FB451DRAFT_1051299 [Mycena latifolia]